MGERAPIRPDRKTVPNGSDEGGAFASRTGGEPQLGRLLGAILPLTHPGGLWSTTRGLVKGTCSAAVAVGGRVLGLRHPGAREAADPVLPANWWPDDLDLEAAARKCPGVDLYAVTVDFVERHHGFALSMLGGIPSWTAAWYSRVGVAYLQAHRIARPDRDERARRGAPPSARATRPGLQVVHGAE
ncbi:hypothetical protein [Rhodococcus sp. SJ]|uniref:hypothetical protein n=1 Tax=Rhodococcus sp. SJ TaxID=3434112 RepID=UPI003D7ADC1A